ncbi:translation initiation factor IF-2 N-terminal domain-containing protein [Mycobacterium sp. 134]
MRVYELARQLGWSPKQLMQVLNDRGEYVNSPMNKVEAPIVRSILRDFAAQSHMCNATEADTALDSLQFGRSAAITEAKETGSSFAADLARVRSTSSPAGLLPAAGGKWLPAVLRALLDEIIVPNRREDLGAPTDGRAYYPWEMGKAKALHKEWARQQLLGLDGSSETIIEWIRLTGDGQRPYLATNLALSGITAQEAALRLRYGRLDPLCDNIFSRYRDKRISKTEAVAEIYRWRRNQQAG